MVKELVFNPKTQILNPANEQNVAGASQIPSSVRKMQLRLVDEVSVADFIQAAQTEEMAQPIEDFPRHAVANGLVEGHGYPQMFFQVDASFREALEKLAGDYYIDDKQILSYRMVDAGKVAGFIDLPPEARNMQLVFRSKALTVKEDEEEEQIIDMIAIRVEGQPKINPEQVFSVNEVTTPQPVTQIETPVGSTQDQVASFNQFILNAPDPK